MADKSNPITSIFTLIWSVGFLWFVWKVFYYFVSGKKLGRPMFIKKTVKSEEKVIAQPASYTKTFKTVIRGNSNTEHVPLPVNNSQETNAKLQSELILIDKKIIITSSNRKAPMENVQNIKQDSLPTLKISNEADTSVFQQSKNINLKETRIYRDSSPIDSSLTNDVNSESSSNDLLPTITISFDSIPPMKVVDNVNDQSFALPKVERIVYHASIPAAQWKKTVEEIILKQVTIKGGMIYLGSSDASSEPSMIDIDTPVEANPQGLTEDFGYFPSYNRLTYSQKAAYLYWLSNGRDLPNITMGYIFIYFYGLERRLLYDLKGLPENKEEALVIYNEVKRLLSIYGTSDSFIRYASKLLNVVNGLYEFEQFQSIASRSDYEYEIPLSLKIKLGRYAVEGKPLPINLVLTWIENNGYLGTRTAYLRCHDEFLTLFASRYGSLYDEGITYKKVPKRELRVDYQFCNYSLGGSFKHTIEGIPDVTSSNHVFTQVCNLFDECLNELDAFSRFIGRNPNGRDSLTAQGLLPREVLLSSSNPIIQSFSKWLASQFVHAEIPIISKSNLLEQLQLSPTTKITPKEWLGIVVLMGKLGIGIEVDPRHSNTKFDKVINFVLFKLAADAEMISTPEYAFALLFLHLGSHFGGSTAAEAESERIHLLNWIHSQKAFSKTEKKRLSVYLAWLYVERPEVNTLKKKIQALSTDQQSNFIAQLIVVAGIDGLIEPKEIQVLQQIYEWVGKDPTELFADLHNLESDGISTKSKKGNTKVESGDQLASTTGNIVLDQKKIDKKRKETKAVNSILSDVFNEQESITTATVAKKSKGITIGSLDEVHSSLLLELLEKRTWTRSEFEGLCEGKSLFADGALEMINECAYSITNEPLIDEDDIMTIDLTVAEQLKSK